MNDSLNDLTRAFMAATDWERSFQLLDEICNKIIASSTRPSDEAISDPEVLKKVAFIDLKCEKEHAAEILKQGASRDSLEQYPWLLYQYYKSEVDFIKQNLDMQQVKTIACFGHGSIPTIALALLEEKPDLDIQMFDIDEEASDLAQKLVRQFHPDAHITFNKGDIETFASDTTYDLAIVTNAPIPWFAKRQEPLNCRHLFIRSATPAGAIAYPRIRPQTLIENGYNICDNRKDPEYGIHEWLLAAPAFS